jgi:hypothetical protein
VLEVLGDVVAGDLLQGAVVQLRKPVVIDEARDQVTHEFGVGEQEFVACVMGVTGWVWGQRQEVIAIVRVGWCRSGSSKKRLQRVFLTACNRLDIAL